MEKGKFGTEKLQLQQEIAPISTPEFNMMMMFFFVLGYHETVHLNCRRSNDLNNKKNPKL